MASCNNCQNLLPRTVDRCPVCGVPQVPEGNAVEETPIPTSPGWASDEAAAGAFAAPAPGPAAYAPVAIPDDLDNISSASPIAAIEDKTRVARAASNRVEGNFTLGKKPQHHISIIAAGIIGLLCVLGGAVAGSRIPLPSDTLAFSGEPDLTTVTGDDLTPEAVTAWVDVNGEAFVSVELNGCGTAPGALHGVAIDPRIVLVSASEVESDPTPTIVTQDGTRHAGRTVGVLGTTGIAAVRLTTALPTNLSWAPMLNVVEGMDVRIASFANGTVSLQNGTVTQLRRNSAGVVGMDVDPASGRGSVVINENNLVIGVVGVNGTFAADAEELSARTSDAVLNPSQIEPVCPAP